MVWTYVETNRGEVGENNYVAVEFDIYDGEDLIRSNIRLAVDADTVEQDLETYVEAVKDGVV